MKNCPDNKFSSILMNDIKGDTVILGGGIAGITTIATLLKDLGYSVAIIEVDRIVEDVTTPSHHTQKGKIIIVAGEHSDMHV